MASAEPIYPPAGIFSPRHLAEQAFSRAAGAPLVPGNQIRILKNAEENYPVWLSAIRQAKRSVHFESYIIKDDRIGQSFAEAFIQKAREGVRVRMIYDWLGARGIAGRRFWKRLRAGGVEVRCFNPPWPDNPLAWLRRDHRKLIVVDGEVGFVGGLCVGDDWVGNAARGIEPWRDTAVEMRGPAVADLEWDFADMWKAAGGPAVPEQELPSVSQKLPAAGSVSLRVVATNPNTASLYRLEQLIAALARQSIWLTDAYFVATTPFLQALGAAAMDSVDVRLLVPRVSDIPFVRSLSRAGYRPLLEAGVRVFEWNGTMLHAKTAVVDGRWARVGSSNLNLASWIGNWELDVIAEDRGFAQEMERMYLEDLALSTEIVLEHARRVRPLERPRRRARRRLGQGSAGRAASGMLAITNTIGAVITRRRILGPAEASLMFAAGMLLVLLSVIGWIWPLLLAIPLGIAGVWVGLALLLGAYKLWRKNRVPPPGAEAPETPVEKKDEARPAPGQQTGSLLKPNESPLQSKQ
ncbi:MAG TPA: phospholipase D-like domain-containing protein [Patescibacteria group bacterium]|nr:phospholipase D-like domain-containing protein [Patescibacteria group bacterium]